MQGQWSSFWISSHSSMVGLKQCFLKLSSIWKLFLEKTSPINGLLKSLYALFKCNYCWINILSWLHQHNNCCVHMTFLPLFSRILKAPNVWKQITKLLFFLNCLASWCSTWWWSPRISNCSALNGFYLKLEYCLFSIKDEIVFYFEFEDLNQGTDLWNYQVGLF